MKTRQELQELIEEVAELLTDEADIKLMKIRQELIEEVAMHFYDSQVSYFEQLPIEDLLEEAEQMNINVDKFYECVEAIVEQFQSGEKRV
jgi:hypothetical protein